MPPAPSPGSGPGYETVELTLGDYRVTVAVEFGPRVVGLRFQEGPELLARLPAEVVIEHPESGRYRLHGGHRLWAAPEIPQLTYAPDDHRCEIDATSDGVSVAAPPDRVGLAKSISVRLSADRLVVDHSLTNQNGYDLDVAPWAITQLPTGGTAVLPVRSGIEQLQATHSLSLWSYTDLSDRRLGWRRDCVLIAAEDGPPIKLGTGPDPKRLGYWRAGQLFVKGVPAATDGPYADRGAVAQVYANGDFCELESLGPIVHLEPGEATGHTETWWVEPCDDLEQARELVLG